METVEGTVFSGSSHRGERLQSHAAEEVARKQEGPITQASAKHQGEAGLTSIIKGLHQQVSAGAEQRSVPTSGFSAPTASGMTSQTRLVRGTPGDIDRHKCLDTSTSTAAAGVMRTEASSLTKESFQARVRSAPTSMRRGAWVGITSGTVTRDGTVLRTA